MKNFIFLLLILLFTKSFSQSDTIKIISYDTIYETRTINIVDTVYVKTDVLVKNDAINQTILKSEYNDLYEKLLDQKNSHYDSSLTSLQVIAGILAIVLTIILALAAYFGWNRFDSMNESFKTLFKEEKENIEKRINQKTEELTRLKYEKDINELKESNNNLERFANDASESFSVKRGKNKPVLYTEVKTPKSKTNPFDAKK
tara:strand:+ start:1250 stop:1855 length:606 start_codon:yes stop_codon:yes gene_type:complete